MSSAHFVRVTLALTLLLGCVSCAELQTTHSGQRAHRSRKHKPAFAFRLPEWHLPFWEREPAKGPAKIVADLSEQRAYLFRGRSLVMESSISTGRKGFETPPGNYRVIQKDAHHFSNLYGAYVNESGAVVKANAEPGHDVKPPGTSFAGAPMPYFLRFQGGYGMHAGYVPRFRASHGCIRMPRAMAQRFFDAARLGTPVTVKE